MSAPRPAVPETRRSTTVLVVDDEPEIRRLLQEILEDEHYSVVVAESANTARHALRNHRPDLVLLDIWLPDTDGITLLKEWSLNGLDAAVIMLSGHGTVETAVEATRLGAYDFIEKPVSMGKLLVTVERALESRKLKRENVLLKAQAEPVSFLTGKSAIMRSLRATLERVAASDAWVMITGEPGCGKAVAARYLHDHSARHERPLIETALGALPPGDIALRLYGEERDGQVTPGAFEQAHGGALLLNEVSELDSTTQAKLSTVLSEKRLRRINGREWLPLNVRLISTTSHNLPRAVAEGRLREDLFYRLNVVPVAIPSLREHREDVPELVNTFIDWMVDRENMTYRRFTTGALNVLRQHEWPGNIRELRNLVQRLLILNREDEISESEVRAALGETPAAAGDAPAPRAWLDLPLKRAREEFEHAYFAHHLARVGGNIAELAKFSGMERTHPYRKLKQLGLGPKSGKD
jgi:DNA-binding NtrC family response regulator